MQTGQGDDSSKCDSCALCGQRAPLRASHIIPAFVFRWLRETSATGHMRFGQQPNLRVQDGRKVRMLCDACEQRFSYLESTFARRLFQPLSRDAGMRVRYQDWLAKFCTSLSWRLLADAHNHLERGFDHLSDGQRLLVASVQEVWRDFLLGRRRDLGPFVQHLLPIDPITAFSTPGLPDNINRYLLRSVEIDLVAGDDTAFAFTKIGRFLVFGFIHPPDDEWVGSLVRRRGTVGGAKTYKLPAYMLDYLKGRASRYGKLTRSLSAPQQKRIEHDVKSNLGRWERSETKVAVEHDIALFGPGSFIKRRPDSQEEAQ